MLFLLYVLYPIELEDISYVITLPTNAHHGPAWPTTAHSIALFGPLQPTTFYNGLLRPTKAYYGLLRPTTAYYSLLRPTTAYYSLLRRSAASIFGFFFEIDIFILLQEKKLHHTNVHSAV